MIYKLSVKFSGKKEIVSKKELDKMKTAKVESGKRNCNSFSFSRIQILTLHFFLFF